MTPAPDADTAVQHDTAVQRDLDGERRRAAVRVALGLGDHVDAQPDPDRIYHLDPALLLGGPNVRADLRADLEFTASLVEHGVLEVITCYLRDGELVVYRGRRRSYFAAQAGLTAVPVRLLSRPAEIDRVARQVTENDKRTDLTTVERAAAVEQLTLLDVPLAQIGKKLAMRRSDVDAALTVARSAAARAAAAEHQLDLGPAAAVAEVADDPAAVAAVVAAAADPATSGGVEHVLQEIRDARRDQADRAAAADRLRATGVQVLDGRPPADSPARRLAELHLTVADHTTCGGHAAYLVQREGVVDGHRGIEWVPEWVCSDPKGFGHGGRQATLDQVARAQQRAAQRARQEETDRAWRAADQVRRRWLRDLAVRTTPPDGAQRWILEVLLRDRSALPHAMEYSRHELLRDLLGAEHAAEAGIAQVVARAGAASRDRLVVLQVLVLLAAMEEQLTAHPGYRHAGADNCAYLAQLVAWGYRPSPVEQHMLAAGDGAAGDGSDAHDVGPAEVPGG